MKLTINNKQINNKTTDLTNQIIGNIKVLDFDRYSDDGKRDAFWACLCLKCNKEYNVRARSLTKKNHVNSCGCDIRRSAREKNKNYKGCGELSLYKFNSIIYSAKARNKIFTITIEYAWNLFLNQNRKCALTGVDLQFSTKARDCDGTASLDCIDPSKGYIEGNVQWVHQDINYMKSDFTVSELLIWCNKIINYFHLNNG